MDPPVGTTLLHKDWAKSFLILLTLYQFVSRAAGEGRSYVPLCLFISMRYCILNVSPPIMAYIRRRL